MTFSIKVYSSLNEKKNFILARPSEITAPIHYMGSSLANNGILLKKNFFRLENTIFHWLFSLFHICISKYK